MYGGFAYGQVAYASALSLGFDVVPPGITIDISSTATKISSVTGKNESSFTLTSDENFQAYKIKAVPDGSSPHTAGTLIESGGSGTAGVPKAVDVTASELSAASLGEGTHVIKVFVQDAAGNWST